MQVVAGVDCHPDTHSIVFLNSVGKLLNELTVPTSSEGYHQALQMASVYDELKWGLESTGCYGSSFAKRLPASVLTIVAAVTNLATVFVVVETIDLCASPQFLYRT
jgi:transposase